MENSALAMDKRPQIAPGDFSLVPVHPKWLPGSLSNDVLDFRCPQSGLKGTQPTPMNTVHAWVHLNLIRSAHPPHRLTL
jgi:hypothetical protein